MFIEILASNTFLLLFLLVFFLKDLAKDLFISAKLFYLLSFCYNSSVRCTLKVAVPIFKNLCKTFSNNVLLHNSCIGRICGNIVPTFLRTGARFYAVFPAERFLHNFCIRCTFIDVLTFLIDSCKILSNSLTCHILP